MLEELSGAVTAFYVWPNHDRGDVSSAVTGIAVKRLIKHDDQDPVFLELRIVEEGGDIGFQPIVCGCQASAMRVVQDVWNDEGKSR